MKHLLLLLITGTFALPLLSTDKKVPIALDKDITIAPASPTIPYNDDFLDTESTTKDYNDSEDSYTAPKYCACVSCVNWCNEHCNPWQVPIKTPLNVCTEISGMAVITAMAAILDVLCCPFIPAAKCYKSRHPEIENDIHISYCCVTRDLIETTRANNTDKSNKSEPPTQPIQSRADSIIISHN